MITFLKNIKSTLLELSEVISSMRTNLIDIKRSLNEFSIKTGNWNTIGFASGGGVFDVQSIWLNKCYFTKEIINKEATNTKELFVIENNAMTRFYFKDWNQSKDIREINGKLYLFK